MDEAAHLGSLKSAIDRFAGLVGHADLDAPVPSCPGWDVGELVAHVVATHAWVQQILERGRDAARPDGETERPARQPTAYASWYAEAGTAMHADLAARDQRAPCWNFSGTDQTVGFWPRRQTHEVNVHAFDASLAAGQEIAIDPGEAADGIDEIFTVFGPRLAKRGISPTLAAPITFAPNDVDRSWTVMPPGEDGVATVAANSAASVATVSGTASDILLGLWNRVPVDRLRVTGEVVIVDAYLASTRSP